jgi:hypothetical protein
MTFYFTFREIKKKGKFLYPSLTLAKTVTFSFATTKANYSMKTLFDLDMGRLTNAGIFKNYFGI